MDLTYAQDAVAKLWQNYRARSCFLGVLSASAHL